MHRTSNSATFIWSLWVRVPPVLLMYTIHLPLSMTRTVDGVLHGSSVPVTRGVATHAVWDGTKFIKVEKESLKKDWQKYGF